MGIFGRNKIIDYTEDYHYDRKKAKQNNVPETSKAVDSSPSQENTSGGFFSNFFGSSGSSSGSNISSSTTVGEIGNTHQGNFDPETGKPLDVDERKRRLAMRLKNMTDRLEDLSNQIYQLQQRVEVLEKKTNVGRYE